MESRQLNDEFEKFATEKKKKKKTFGRSSLQNYLFCRKSNQRLLVWVDRFSKRDAFVRLFFKKRSHVKITLCQPDQMYVKINIKLIKLAGIKLKLSGSQLILKQQLEEIFITVGKVRSQGTHFRLKLNFMGESNN